MTMLGARVNRVNKIYTTTACMGLTVYKCFVGQGE